MKRALWMAASPLVKITTYVVLILATIWVLIPFVWSLQNSIKTMADIFNPLAIIPFINYRPTLDSWIKVLGDPGAVNALYSSIIVSAGATLLVILIGTPAAYSLAQFEFPIRTKHLNFWFFSQRVMPPVVLLVPFFILFVQFRLVDTWIGLILIYTTFNINCGMSFAISAGTSAMPPRSTEPIPGRSSGSLHFRSV